jgi:hypothetical protein
MIHKAQDKKDEATQAFQQTLKLFDQEKGEKNASIDMLKRLAKGHINEITLGIGILKKRFGNEQNEPSRTDCNRV